MQTVTQKPPKDPYSHLFRALPIGYHWDIGCTVFVLAVLTARFAEVMFGDTPVPRKRTGELGVEEVPPTVRSAKALSRRQQAHLFIPAATLGALTACEPDWGGA